MMNKFISTNEWNFSGKIFYLKELSAEYAASIKIRGSAKRRDNTYASPIVEIGCLVTKNAYEKAKLKGIALHKNISVSGHLETFYKDNGNSKTMFIAEEIKEVS